MTDSEIYNALFGGGKIVLPYLIKLTSDNESLFFVNNNESILYNGDAYIASNFEYTAPDDKGIGGSLSIDAKQNTLVEFFENANKDNVRLDVIGCLVDGGTIQPLKRYKHFRGSISYNQDMNIDYTLSGDDRQDMTFTVYVYDTDNNPGNT